MPSQVASSVPRARWHLALVARAYPLKLESTTSPFGDARTGVLSSAGVVGEDGSSPGSISTLAGIRGASTGALLRGVAPGAALAEVVAASPRSITAGGRRLGRFAAAGVVRVACDRRRLRARGLN